MFPKPTFFKISLCVISTDKGNTCSFFVYNILLKKNITKQ